MDPVTLIVAALGAGATAGLSGTTSTAIQDAYGGLRDAIRRRLSRDERSGEQAVAVLDAHATDPEAERDRMTETLAASGVSADAEVVAAARGLLAMVDPAGDRGGKYIVDASQAKGVYIGDYGTQHNTFG